MIFLCMHGAPSHVDTFDFKPVLSADSGKPSPIGRLAGAKLLGSPWPFKQHGQSGQWVSELFPEVGSHADELCVIRSMQTNLPAHPQAYLMMHTGHSQLVRPSLGAWTLYGLGTENENLPGFIAIKPVTRNGGPQNYGNAFLPPIYQGTRIGSEAAPVASAELGNIRNPRLDQAAQRMQLDLVQAMNRKLLERERVQPGVEGVIESYELAFRMQGALPRVMSLADESTATQSLYGIDEEETGDFGRQCLLAPARRGGRAVRRAQPRQLGPAPQLEGRSCPARPRRRQANCGLADRPESSRALERHAGDLGRRVRAHASRPERRRPRPQ